MSAAPSASAQVSRVSLGFQGRHGNLSLNFGAPFQRPGYTRQPVCPVPTPGGHGGHWRVIEEKVWVPGRIENVYVDPIYETRYDHCGNPYRVLVRAGCWSTIEHPGHWEIRQRKVWEPELRYGISRLR
jgi:hypothetical protein